MSVAGDWEKLSAGGSPEEALLAFLDCHGLGSYKEKIVQETDAESVDDLRLIDEAMLEKVIQAVGLKLVSAKKLRLALAQLRGEAAAPEPAAAPAPAEGSSAAAEAAGADAEAPAPPKAPEVRETREYVVVCVDRSGSMATPFNEVVVNVVEKAKQQRSRMEAVKAMFYAFRDRVESVGGQGGHQMALIQFDGALDTLLELTPRLDRFEAIVDEMQPRGMTAIYSSVAEAAKMLKPHFKAEGGPDLRVVVLTDGQSNTGASPEAALEVVGEIGAVVDAIIVGDRPDSNLRRIVNATGGECWQISDLGEGFELLEAEGVVSLQARRGGAEKPAFKPPARVEFSSLAEKSLTTSAQVQRAPVLDQKLASKAVVSIDKVKDDAAAAAASGRGANSAKRLLAELKKVTSGEAYSKSGAGIHIFPAGDSLNFWRVLMEGPAGSPFEGGVFALTVVAPDDYPFKAPNITFETPIYHCNVSDSGKICLDVIQERWAPSCSIPQALEAIRQMLLQPNTDDALRQWIAELTIAHEASKGADTRYFDKGREATARDAAATVEQWRQKWGC